MRKQSGYINLDGVLSGLLIIGAVIGIVVYIIASWAWPFIKAFIHQITA